MNSFCITLTAGRDWKGRIHKKMASDHYLEMIFFCFHWPASIFYFSCMVLLILKGVEFWAGGSFGFLYYNSKWKFDFQILEYQRRSKEVDNGWEKFEFGVLEKFCGEGFWRDIFSVEDLFFCCHEISKFLNYRCSSEPRSIPFFFLFFEIPNRLQNLVMSSVKSSEKNISAVFSLSPKDQHNHQTFLKFWDIKLSIDFCSRTALPILGWQEAIESERSLAEGRPKKFLWQTKTHPLRNFNEKRTNLFKGSRQLVLCWSSAMKALFQLIHNHKKVGFLSDSRKEKRKRSKVVPRKGRKNPPIRDFRQAWYVG